MVLKIEPLQKGYIFIKKMPRPIKWWNLEFGKEYFVQRNVEPYKYKIIYSGLEGRSYFGDSESAWFIDRGFYIEFDQDIFYDAEEIKEKGQKAREKMEKRSLDMILKKLVNETFEWF